MSMVQEITAGQTIRLREHVVGIERSAGRIVDVPQPGGPPKRIDGHTIGLVPTGGESPHDGEMHPDGDELLCLLSGRISVRLELADGVRDVVVEAGDALVVPRGTWHLITCVEPGELLHITPGPNGDARPRRRP